MPIVRQGPSRANGHEVRCTGDRLRRQAVESRTESGKSPGPACWFYATRTVLNADSTTLSNPESWFNAIAKSPLPYGLPLILDGSYGP